MPRRDDYDDDRPRPKKRDNTLLYVLLAVGGVAVLGCGGVGALVAFGWTRAVQDVQQRSDTFQPTMARDEFKKAVIGRTPEEVTAAVGRPDRTVGDSDPTWFYSNRTIDPANGKVDGMIRVRFTGGKVSGVVFN